MIEIQQRLRVLGFDPGPLDGVRGRRTIAAIRAFQAVQGLDVDGMVGPLTLAALIVRGFGSSVPEPAAEQLWPWYAEAERLCGIQEAAGAADNPVILRWARALGLAYSSDSVAWCGLFVAHCIAASLPEEPLPTNPLGARSWLRFGAPAEPGSGAVLVFWRGRPAGWQGHVGFYAGEDETAFHVLGGNQGDRVSVARLAKTRFLGARWPSTGPPQVGGRIVRGRGQELSTNEA